MPATKCYPRYVSNSGSDSPSVDGARAVHRPAWMGSENMHPQYTQPLPEGIPPRAVTPLEALMRTPPGSAPERSFLELHERLEAIRDAIDEVLDDRERWVIEAAFWRGISLRSIGRELSLSKTQVARVRDEAMLKLQEALEYIIFKGDTDT